MRQTPKMASPPFQSPAAPHGVLTAPTLRRALIAGARRVIAGRDELNRINVFPVADGDTGSNLAHTVGSLLHGALARRSRHAGDLMQRVGEDAIDGARGNSGAILAQFLYGAAAHAGAHQRLDATMLAAAVREGARSAREALAAPVEGTILTVIDRFADALEAAALLPQHDPRRAFTAALQHARDALADTPRQLAVLQRAGVVDAGAQGFVDLLEGIAEYGNEGPRAVRVRAPLASANEGDAGVAMTALAHAAGGEVDPRHRWCTECLVLGDAIDRLALHDALKTIDATSTVLAGGATRLRVHAHVARPQDLFDACARFGELDAQKADDMLLQSVGAQRGARVAIVTDSGADLADALLLGHAVQLVPLRVMLDGRDYLDKVGLSTAAFYRRMAVAEDLPRTSQPPPGDFRRAFELAAAHHAQVVYVGVSRALSGTLQSAETAAERHARRDDGGLTAPDIRIVDTVNAAGGQGLLVWRAAELADAGADADAIVAELERLRPLTRTWAMIPDLSHGVRGGRLPAWAGTVARWSGLTPLARMSARGRLGMVGALLGRRRAPEAFAAYIARRVDAGTRWRAVLGHCDAEPAGERLLRALEGRLDLADAQLVVTGSAIGAHAGQGTLVVALQPAPDADAGAIDVRVPGASRGSTGPAIDFTA